MRLSEQTNNLIRLLSNQINTMNLLLLTIVSIPSLHPLHLTNHQPIQDQECPTPSTCKWYKDCLESTLHCGPTGYPLDYGYKFCTNLIAHETEFSPAGQKWLTSAMKCLMDKLIPYATGQKPTTCTELEHYAFSTHPDCYVDNGFCELPVGDWVVLVDVIGLKTFLGSLDVLGTTGETALKCLRSLDWAYGTGEG